MSTGYTPPFFLEKFSDASGKPLSGGSLTFLVAGSTSLPKDIYLDFGLTNPAANPLTLLSDGTAPQYYMQSGQYKVVVKDSAGAIVATRDYIEGSGSGSGGGTDAFTVKTNTQDSTPGTLTDKIQSTSTITATVRDIGGHDYLLDLTVNESGLNGFPKGPAGGDLSGFYPNPIVKQLTGVAASMVPKTPGFSYSTSPAMTGIGYGYIYQQGVPVKAWGAISFGGHIRWSTDEWVSSFEDNSLYVQGASSTWNCMSFIKSGNDFYWIFGHGDGPIFYYVKHEAASYNADGTFRSSAWQNVAYAIAASGQWLPTNVGDVASFNSTTLWVGNSAYIGRTTDLVNFTGVTAPNRGKLGGIATDNYDTWMAVVRDTGELLVSTGNGGTTFTQVTNITVNGVANSALPTSKGELWGSLLCSYGTWVAAVYSGSAGHVSYAYSTDRVNWTTVTNSDIAFFSAASNGVAWYATNPAPDSVNPIYQLLISEIPAHKKLIAEQGLAVAGNLHLVDIPNASVLSTDANGKVVASDGLSFGGKVLVDSADTTKGFLLDKLGTTNGLAYTVIRAGADEKVMLSANGKTIVSATDTTYGYLQDKIAAGAGITITPVTDGTYGTRLSINARGNSWRLVKYLTSSYTVLDTDDTLIIRGTGVTVTLPTPSAAYEGRIITVRNAGAAYSGNVSGVIVGSSGLTNLTKLEFMCYNTGTGYFWVQQ